MSDSYEPKRWGVVLPVQILVGRERARTCYAGGKAAPREGRKEEGMPPPEGLYMGLGWTEWHDGAICMRSQKGGGWSYQLKYW